MKHTPGPWKHARLIAAAPEMLEFIKELYNKYEPYFDKEDFSMLENIMEKIGEAEKP